MNGILCVDKPRDFTSFDVVAVCRRLCGTRKIGHSGTLDPMATGVLPLFIGNTTKAVSLLPDHTKSYCARFVLGLATDTQDITGTILQRRPVSVLPEDVERLLPRFKGDILQVPPMVSAVKHQGQRLYDLARQGITVEREARPVTIYSLSVRPVDREKQEYEMNVTCSAGTYIRTLAADIGEALGCGATLTSLRRTQACGFSLHACIPLEQLRQMAPDEIASKLIPVEQVFSRYPAVTVTNAQAVRFSNGGALSLERIKGELSATTVRVYSPDNRFLGLGKTDTKERELQVLRLFPD